MSLLAPPPLTTFNSRVERTERIVDEYDPLSDDVRLDAIRRTMRLLQLRPSLTDAQVVAVLRKVINPIADYWYMEND